ncbi:LacI family DNA-binding transcriptional regulator [soil metagenome]
MAKGPTVYDVAQRAGVSIATVSFAFRRSERVKDSTREAILAAARDLGYVPNASARGLARGRTGALGLYSFDYLVDARPETVDPATGGARGVEDESRPNDDLRAFPLYVDEVQRGVELECWHRGYALMIGGGGHAIERAVVDVVGRVDGLVVFPQTMPAGLLQRVTRRIPVVELAHPSREDYVNHVTVDNAAGMRELTRHLITGHARHDLVFVGSLSTPDTKERFEGFRAAMRAHGLPVRHERPSNRGPLIRQAAAVVHGLLERRGLPEGLVCATDHEALAVMDALIDAGIEIPRRVTVTGFDGIAAGRVSRPTLTTVRQPMEQMGRVAVDILISRLGSADGPPTNRRLLVRTVLRESCGCQPG